MEIPFLKTDRSELKDDLILLFLFGGGALMSRVIIRPISSSDLFATQLDLDLLVLTEHLMAGVAFPALMAALIAYRSRNGEKANPFNWPIFYPRKMRLFLDRLYANNYKAYTTWVPVCCYLLVMLLWELGQAYVSSYSGYATWNLDMYQIIAGMVGILFYGILRVSRR